MKTFFTILLTTLILCAFTQSVVAAGPTEADFANYKRYYHKYVDSKEPLVVLNHKDVRDMTAAESKIRADMNNPETAPLFKHITIAYGPRSLQQLDIYPGSSKGKLKPVIFFIHGGYLDKSTVEFAIPVWIPLGYEVVSINHRRLNSGFPAMFKDCNVALKWVMDNIQRYGGDPNRIAITGHSCGAHLAALLVTDVNAHKKYHIDINKIRCWFPMCGFYDMNLKENYLSPFIKRYVKKICIPSKYAASPIDHVTGKEPPSLIIDGADDWCVPKTNAIELYKKLREKGAKSQLAILKGYMHANVFDCYFENNETAKRVNHFLATYLPTPENPAAVNRNNNHAAGRND